MKNQLGYTIATVILIAVVLFLAVDVGFTLYNPDQHNAELPICTLTVISGDIRVQARDTLTWEKAEDGMMLEPGSRVRTNPDSHASLTFSQGTTTKLEPSTDLILANLESQDNTLPDTIVLKQILGKTWNQVSKRLDGSTNFQIQTSSADVRVYGTLFATEVDELGKTLVETAEGQVNVSAQGEEVQVCTGQQTEVELGTAPSAPTPMPPAKNELVFTINRPAAGLITGPSGSSTGYLPDGSPLNQISGSRLSTTEEPSQTVRIPEPNMGEYDFVLNGASDGDGEISYSIEGFTDGKSTFMHIESCNITAVNEKVLKLHLDVLDGLLQGVTVQNPESPGVQPAQVTPTLKTTDKTNETASLTEKSPGSDVKAPVVSQNEEETGQELSWFRPGSVYQYNKWFVITSVIVLFTVVFAIVWRKH